MIIRLDNANNTIAKHIFTVFQRSYKIEANLIGTTVFPPLSRRIKDIENSTTQFYGFIENNCLAAVIEIADSQQQLEINSLTVDPDFFRKGIAGKLIGFTLANFKFTKAFVETAVVNLPAIELYRKHGFVEFKRYTPSHGIEKIAMSLSPTD